MIQTDPNIFISLTSGSNKGQKRTKKKKYISEHLKVKGN